MGIYGLTYSLYHDKRVIGTCMLFCSVATHSAGIACESESTQTEDGGIRMKMGRVDSILTFAVPSVQWRHS